MDRLSDGMTVKSRTNVMCATRAFRRMAIYRNICASTPAKSRIPVTSVAENSPRHRNLGCM